MSLKKIITGVLLLFVVTSIGFLVFRELNKTNNNQTSRSEADKADIKEDKSALNNLNHIVKVYYFHTTFRCYTCTKMEEYIKEVINTYFVKEIESGTLEFNAVNVEKFENKHFVEDYKLHTKSLVIVNMKDGKQTEWGNLKEIWNLFYSKSKFMDYVKKEIQAYLGGK